MKKIALLLALLFSLSLLAGCMPMRMEPAPVEPQRILITDQLHEELRIYDLRNEDLSEPEWSWGCDEETFRSVDGAKYRFDPISGVNVIAFCSSGGFAGIVTYPVGELISYVPRAGNNPHSVEILPDGALAVASSTGNTVRIYPRIPYGDAELTEYTQVELSSAHGVLWDPAEEVLWALGMTDLVAYEVTEDHKMIERDDLSIHLPYGGGHDLQPVFGTEDLFWVTGNSNVMQVNKTTGEVSIRYPGWGTVSALTAVKGIGNFDDGTLLMAQQNGTYKEWNTNTVTLGYYDAKDNLYHLEQRVIPDVAFYKLRVFEKNYR